MVLAEKIQLGTTEYRAVGVIAMVCVEGVDIFITMVNAVGVADRQPMDFSLLVFSSSP